MPSKATFSYKDYDSEVSHTTVNITTMTAANFDAVNTAVNALSTAILAIQTENALQTKRVMSADNFISRAKATEKASQRENKWLCTIEDATTHHTTRFEIPLADLDQLGTDSEFMPLGAGVGAALKSAVEGVVVYPNTGNAVNLLTVQFVGKRL